jgi:hypothetical protein
MFYTLINYIYPQTPILPTYIEKNKKKDYIKNDNLVLNMDNNKMLLNVNIKNIDIENGVHKLAFFDAVFN